MHNAVGIQGPAAHYSPSMVGYHANYDPELAGFFSSIGKAFKQVGSGLTKVVKKALPVAAPFIPGVGGVIAGMAADRLAAKQAPPPGYVGPLTPAQQAGQAAQQRLAAAGQPSYNPLNPGSYPQWNGTGSNFVPYWGRPSLPPMTQGPPVYAGGRRREQAPAAPLGLGDNLGMLLVLGGLAVVLAVSGRR